MFVELHILQNFAPANLNRDDTGSPKSCEFGGFRRARVSSQSWKRAIRTDFKEDNLIPSADRAIRTLRAVEEVARRLAARGRDETVARDVVAAALNGFGLGVKDDGKTEYLLFLGEREIIGLTDACDQSWDQLSASQEAAAAGGQKARKKAAKDAISPGLKTALTGIFDGGRAVDLALFGRMLAGMPAHNIDAATQVAQAISTNRVSMEFDFYTAVDDLNPAGATGAGMMGTIEFNSACFYRYMNVDLRQLTGNLGGDAELARRAVEAFLRAAISAVPSGKQNSMAAHNPPSLVFAVVREHGLWSLANAFLQPVRPGEGADLVERSVEALDGYWRSLTGMYPDNGIRARAVCTHVEGTLGELADDRVENIEQLVAKTIEALA